MLRNRKIDLGKFFKEAASGVALSAAAGVGIGASLMFLGVPIAAAAFAGGLISLAGSVGPILWAYQNSQKPIISDARNRTPALASNT